MDADRPKAARTTNRSPELVARIERSHQRSQQRRAAAKTKEKTLTGAVTDFLTAWNAIELAAARRDQQIAALQQQIDDARHRAATEIAVLERDQAAAAAVVREQVGTDAEVAELLEVPIKRARELLAVSRKPGDTVAPGDAPKLVRDNASTPASKAKPIEHPSVPVSRTPVANAKKGPSRNVAGVADFRSITEPSPPTPGPHTDVASVSLESDPR